MKSSYDHITQEQFDEKLEELVAAMSAGELLGVEGVYEILSEYLNNEVLAEFEARIACGKGHTFMEHDAEDGECPKCIESEEEYLKDSHEADWDDGS